MGMDYLAFIQPGSFRDELVALESATLEMERAALAYETASRLSEIHGYEAELQCYAESGDVFALADYYEAAEQKDAQTKEGLFQKIWNGIKNVWNKIKSVITGDTSGGNPEEQVEVNGPLYALSSLICDSAAEISKMVAHPIQYFISGNGWGKLTEIITFSLAGAGVKKVARKALEKRKKELQALIEKVTGPFEQIPGKIKSWAESHGWGKNVDDVEGFIPKLLARISSCVSHITSALHIGKKKDGEENTDQQGTEGQTGDGKTDSGENTDQTGTDEKTDGQPAEQTGTNDGKQPEQKPANGDQQKTADAKPEQQPKTDSQKQPEQKPAKNQQTEEPQKKQGIGTKLANGVKGVIGGVKNAVTGKNKNKNADEEDGKTESGEDFINSVFDGLEGYTESDDSDIQHMVDEMDDEYMESGDTSVMETVDELTEIFEGYF